MQCMISSFNDSLPDYYKEYQKYELYGIEIKSELILRIGKQVHYQFSIQLEIP